MAPCARHSIRDTFGGHHRRQAVPSHPSEPVDYKGCRVVAKPGFWLRRLPLPFRSFYFDCFNPSFVVEAVCFDKSLLDSSDGKLPIRIDMDLGGPLPNSSHTSNGPFDLSGMKEGELRRFPLGQQMFIPGHVSIKVPEMVTNEHGEADEGYYSLYAFNVRPEEGIWLALGVVLLAVVSPIAAAICQPAVKNYNANNPIIQIVQQTVIATPFVQSTPAPPP